MQFNGHFVLITGGSRGIGAASALAFAQAGATVAVNFHTNRAAAEQVIESLPGQGHLAIRADVSDPEAAQSLIKALLQEWGQIDVLVNNAGVYHFHALDQVGFEKWQQAWQDTLSLNLTAAANLSYLVAHSMIQRGHGGAIINVSSRGAFRGEPSHPAYAASKAGLNALTQSLAVALGKYAIQVAAVAPGFVETDMARSILDGEQGDAIRQQSPFGRVASPEEVAAAILFLAGKQAQFASGTILDVNGASYLRS